MVKLLKENCSVNYVVSGGGLLKLAEEEFLVVPSAEEGQVVIDFYSKASGHSDKQLDWFMMGNKAWL